MLKHLEQRRREDEGFTLIELMVVVLILGILMAIAIPTFLSTTKSAKGVAAESNATNAATSEISNFSTATAFAPSINGTTLDPAVPWNVAVVTANATANTVLVLAGTGVGTVGGTWTAAPANAVPAAAANVMILESLSGTGSCFIIVDDQSLTTPEIGYYDATGGCPALPAASPAGTGTGTPASGSATAHTAAWPGTLTWASLYSNF